MDQLSDEISLKELILKLKKWYQYILSKWVLLMLICFLGSTVGYLYAFFKKPIYTASITYTLDDDKSGSGGGLSGALGLASSFGFDLGGSAGGAFGPSNLMELMHSRYLVEKTLLSTIEVSGKKLTLADYYIEINGLRKQWQNKPDLMDVSFPVNYERKSFTRIQDSVLGSIYTTIDKDQLSITQKDKKVSIGTIEVKSTSEMFAMLFCNQLVKEVTGFYIETKSLKARNNVNIIQKQVDSVRGELNAAITGVAAANDNAFNSNSAFSINKTSASKRQVDVQANSAILTQLVANLEMAKVALLKETPLIQIIDRPIFPLKKEKTSKLISLILGGFLAFFVTCLFLILKEISKSIMKE